MVKPKKDSNRIAKINSLIRRVLGPALHKFLNFQTGLVTISQVETSRDMKWAKVWISIFNGDDNKVLTLLNKNLYYLQGELNKNFHTKIIPRISFHLDTSPRYVQHIDEVIRKINEEKNSK